MDLPRWLGEKTRGEAAEAADKATKLMINSRAQSQSEREQGRVFAEE